MERSGALRPLLLAFLGAAALAARSAPAAAEEPPPPPAPAAAPDPERPEDALKRIDRMRADGDVAGALAEAEKAVKAAPGAAALHARRQDLLLSLGRRDQALAIYREWAAAAPADASRVYLLARLLQGEAALRDLRRAVEMDPSLAPAWQDLSSALAARRQWKDAADASQRAADLLGDAVSRNQLGWLRERAGQVDEAVAAYRTALGKDPAFGLALRNLAYALVRKGAADEAAGLLEGALSRNPADAMAWVALGYAKASRKDYEGARACYEAALSAAPPDAGVLDLLGSTYLRMERADLAEQAFRRALTVRPDDPVARIQIGLLRMGAGDAESAEKEFRAALKAKSGAGEAAHCLGILCDRTDRAEEAVTWYRRAVEAEPGNAFFASSLARSLERRGKYPEALQWFRKASELAPGDSDPVLGAGIVLTRMKRWRDAEETLGIVLALKPDDLRARFYLGVVWADGLRSEPKAREQFQRYVDLGGDEEAVRPWFTDIVKRAAGEKRGEGDGK